MAADVESALERASESFGLCPNRVWSIAYNLEQWQKKLPRLIPSKERGVQMKIVGHHGHEHCTLDLCEYSRLDFTSVKQRHELPRCQSVPCGTLTGLFPRALLKEAALADRPTAWRLDGKSLVETPEPVMAISHVWSDGTGSGGWPDGEVNSCLYGFFEEIARRFQCRGIWWDTICMPREKAARTRAINKIQSNYETARITLVHDCYIREWEWTNAETACLAIIMSPWFSRGWTALELAKSRKVKVLFKGSVIKDLDEDILPQSRSTASAAHRFASDAISRLRKEGVPSINHLLTIMAPRFTSWPRDVPVICGLLAGINISGHMRPHEIYQQILCKIGKLRHGHLFHRSATMQGAFSWCPANLLEFPVAHSTSDELAIGADGQVTGEWIMIDLKDIPEQRFVFNSTHPLSDVRLKTALTNPEGYTLLGEPGENHLSRAILVRSLGRKIHKYLGVVSLQPPFTPDDAGSQEWKKESVTIGDVQPPHGYSSSAADEIGNEGAHRPNRSWMLMGKIIARDRFPRDNMRNWDYKHHTFNQSGQYPPFVPSHGPRLKRVTNDDEWGGVNERLLLSAVHGDERDRLSKRSIRLKINSKDRNSWTALHHAVWRGQRSIVRFLLRQGASVDIQDKLGQQPFHLAAERGDLNILMPMLKSIKRHQACLDGQTVLHRAVLGGSAAVVSTVLSKLDVRDTQDSQGKTALHIAAELGQTEIVRLLISKQANPSLRDFAGRTALHYATMHESGTDEIIRTLLCYDGLNVADLDKRFPLHYAAERGHVSSVKILLQHANLGIEGSFDMTPLGMAARNGHVDAVQALLEYDRDRQLTQRIKDRALYLAVSSNNTEVAQLLVEQGADIWGKEERNGSLIKIAVDNKNSPLTMFLVEAALSAPDKDGCLPNEWSSILTSDPHTGQTPLHQAIEHGYSKVVMELSPKGPAMFEIIQDDSSLLSLAVSLGKKNVVSAILERHREFLRGPLELKPRAEKRSSSRRGRPGPSPEWDRACTCYWLAMRDLFQARKVANSHHEILRMLDPHVLSRSDGLGPSGTSREQAIGLPDGDIRKLVIGLPNTKDPGSDDGLPNGIPTGPLSEEDSISSYDRPSDTVYARALSNRRSKKKGPSTRRLVLGVPKETPVLRHQGEWSDEE